MDLSTRYLGLTLKNPLVSAAGPLSESLDNIKRMEDAGAAAVVLHSLFEEQIRFEASQLEHYMSFGTESFAEALTYFPQPDEFPRGPEEYLIHVRRAKEAVRIPIIASLNGTSTGGWTDYARQIEQAGADALELNIYFVAADPDLTSDEVENRYLDILRSVKKAVSIPVAVKIPPFFSAMFAMARRLDEAGADGLVLFNRFYQPDIDLDTLTVKPCVVLSGRYEMRLPLRWIAILHGRLRASLAATRGIYSAEDVIKMIMAGADVTQLCSVLLQRGVGELHNILHGLTQWIQEREYDSLEVLRGSMSQKRVADPAAFERANYMKTLQSYG